MWGSLVRGRTRTHQRRFRTQGGPRAGSRYISKPSYRTVFAFRTEQHRDATFFTSPTDMQHQNARLTGLQVSFVMTHGFICKTCDFPLGRVGVCPAWSKAC